MVQDRHPWMLDGDDDGANDGCGIGDVDVAVCVFFY